MRTRKGLDRITKQTLQTRKSELSADIDNHLDHCARCKHAGKDVYAHCNVWWILAKMLHRVNRKLKQYDKTETAGMQMLPGFEDFA